MSVLFRHDAFDLIRRARAVGLEVEVYSRESGPFTEIYRHGNNHEAVATIAGHCLQDDALYQIVLACLAALGRR